MSNDELRRVSYICKGHFLSTVPLEVETLNSLVEAVTSYDMASYGRSPDAKFQTFSSKPFSRSPWNLGLNEPAFGEVDILFSDACPKKYILFDQSGGKERVIVNPELKQRVCDIPSEIKSGQSQRELNLNVHETEGLRNMFDMFQSPNRQLHRTRSLSGVFGYPVSADVQEAHTTGKTFFRLSYEKGPISQQSNSFCYAYFNEQDNVYSQDDDSGTSHHEDSADLDALLGSDDDERSTAHSPSDMTCNIGDGDCVRGGCGQQTSEMISGNTCDFKYHDELEVNSSILHEEPPNINFQYTTLSAMPNFLSDSAYPDFCRYGRKLTSPARSKFLRVKNSPMKSCAHSCDCKLIGSLAGRVSAASRSIQKEVMKSKNIGPNDVSCAHHANIRVILNEIIGSNRFLQQSGLELASSSEIRANMNNEDPGTESTHENESDSCLSSGDSSVDHDSFS